VSEQELIQEILNGKTDLFAQIVDENQMNVVNLCYKLCGNRLDIDEVTQQVFVELYQALPRFRNESKLSTFIYRITVNVVSKMLSREKRIVTEDDSLRFERISEERNIEEDIIHNERITQLQNAIQKLKEDQRTALVLYTFEEKSYNEIAESMGWSLAKVESLIFRAKNNLRKMLVK
jgi:RNA polymerase sigma-70 factor (ECF subfamily)